MAGASLLRRADVQTVILVREPLGAIASIVRLTKDFYRAGWSDDRAIDYYTERMATLAALQNHLHLPEPFSVAYPSFEYTGRRGDPCERIRSNSILPPDRHGDDILEASQKLRVGARYRNVLAALRAVCSTSGAS